ncbi:MAG: SDR family oxidoreductase [Actinomycetota bacterium]|jgi:galactitol 2-dehydrogenase
MADLSGKRALVTGAGSGIGREIATVLVESGARVMLSDIDDEALGKAGAELGMPSRHCDVRLAADVERAVQATTEVFGGLDVMCNNAGIEQLYPLVQQPEDEFDRILAVNVKGVWLGIKYGGAVIAASGGGAIVNIASVAGLRGGALLGAYCATKAAVVSLTQTAALEFRDFGVRVNCVCPGLIDTPMLDRLLAPVGQVAQATMGLSADQLVQNIQGRLGSTREVGNVVAYLASDQAAFVSGVSLPVDNGLTARLI